MINKSDNVETANKQQKENSMPKTIAELTADIEKIRTDRAAALKTHNETWDKKEEDKLQSLKELIKEEQSNLDKARKLAGLEKRTSNSSSSTGTKSKLCQEIKDALAKGPLDYEKLKEAIKTARGKDSRLPKDSAMEKAKNELGDKLTVKDNVWTLAK